MKQKNKKIIIYTILIIILITVIITILSLKYKDNKIIEEKLYGMGQLTSGISKGDL